MKNRHTTTLVIITCFFLSFTLGFLAGRTTASGDTIVTQVPKTVTPQETTPATEASSAVPTTAATEAATEPATVPTTVPTTAPPMEAGSGLININTATLVQLDSLPGIGPVIAQRIIDYRQAHGPFTAVSQLTLVEGIGEKRLAAIIDLITVE